MHEAVLVHVIRMQLQVRLLKGTPAAYEQSAQTLAQQRKALFSASFNVALLMLQVGSVLGHMTPTNLRLDLQTSKFDTLRQSQPSAELSDEPWFKMPYLSLPIPEQQIKQWEAALHGPCAADEDKEFVMPERNVYIPTDFALVGSSSSNCNGNANAHANGNATGNGSVTGVKRAREAAQVSILLSLMGQTMQNFEVHCQQ